MPAKKKKSNNNNITMWLYASVLVNVVLIATALVIWIIIIGAGTNRYSNTILSDTEDFVSSHYCSEKGYAHTLGDIQNNKSLKTEADKTQAKQFLDLAICQKITVQQLLREELNNALKSPMN